MSSIIGVIYRIFNNFDSKSYIGQTIQNPAEKRIREHFYLKSGCVKLYSAIKKHGKDNFDWEILKECPIEELDYYETFFINKFNSVKEGYNIEHGGQQSRIVSVETRQKLSESMKGRFAKEKHPLYGKSHSEKTKEKISESHKGIPLSEERKNKISKSMKGKHAGENNPMYGKTSPKGMSGKSHSQETKNKMSESKKGDKSSIYRLLPLETELDILLRFQKGDTASEIHRDLGDVLEISKATFYRRKKEWGF